MKLWRLQQLRFQKQLKLRYELKVSYRELFPLAEAGEKKPLLLPPGLKARFVRYTLTEGD